MKIMILMMIGDIVGRPGRTILREKLPLLRKEYEVDFVIANGENAAGGNGITQKIAQELFISGIDFLTMGNHIWDNKDVFNFIEEEARMVRPANYPSGTPGRGYQVIKIESGISIGIINISGRTFMNALDCPFRTADAIIDKIKNSTSIVIVDFHAEATSEKIAMGWYLDGRATLVAGTHTHVQTADERILPNGTAYITDLGMTGPMNSILGIEKETVIKKFISQLPVRFEVAKGPSQINGIIVEIDEQTGKAQKIQRMDIKEI
ncbi:TIGR00282 family metallophosphoesterase [Biomaibacter acetigenes]|uniref:TIGR00282 family metallophosphoesterase n=2 Tax=Biomaibacter acetigenes TaxID=2316383 RepID=A0A3G2R6S1_9FIRM|nr:TIGR00282 family metallophosphoesterase [Biomaibacter acetigenes]RKL62029.1 TIGR00282 family metallophosphoesterase [Thermoanaerobacteraceae bacterium SP2]